MLDLSGRSRAGRPLVEAPITPDPVGSRKSSVPWRGNTIVKCPTSSSLRQMTADASLCQAARIAGSCCATTRMAAFSFSLRSSLLSPSTSTG